MFIVGLFSWWYGAGWRQRVVAVGERLVGLYDYFSIDLLLRTLFSPFHQISAGGVRGPIGAQLRAWFDQLISRVIGAVVRLLVVVIGVVTLCLAGLIGLVVIIAWPLIPLVPIISVILTMSGWIPWQI